MKNTPILLIAILTLLQSCNMTAVDDLNDCKKPAVVFSKHKGTDGYFGTNSQMTIKDADGELILLRRYLIEQLVDKYEVGDTIY